MNWRSPFTMFVGVQLQTGGSGLFDGDLICDVFIAAW